MRLRLKKHSLWMLITALAAVTAVGALAGTGFASGSKSAAKDTLIVLADDVAPALDLDGANAADPGLQEILLNTMSPLLNYPNKKQGAVLVPQYKVSTQQFQPQLATSWSKSGLTWTFKLRKGVKSRLGNEMTSADIIWAWQRTFATNRLGGLLSRIQNLDRADQVTAPDKYTIQLNLTARSSLPEAIATLVYLPVYDTVEVKKHVTADDPWASSWLANNAAGYGPYYIALFQPGQQIVLKANPNYYLGVPKIKLVVYRQVPDASTRAALVKRGDVDIALNLSPDQLNDLKKDSNVKVSEFRGNGQIALLTQFNHPILKKAKVRQALAYATPYAQILNDVYKGYAEPSKSYMPPIYLGYTDKWWPYKTDYAKAKQLLQEAGVTTPINLTLTYAPLQPTDEQVVVALKSAYANIGVNVEIKVITPALNGATLAGRNFELMFYRLISHVTDPLYTLQVFNGQGKLAATNWVNYKSRIVDQKFDEGATVIKFPARLAYASDIQRAMVSDPPHVVMGTTKWVVAHRKNISGIAWMPQESLWFSEITKSKS